MAARGDPPETENAGGMVAEVGRARVDLIQHCTVPALAVQMEGPKLQTTPPTTKASVEREQALTSSFAIFLLILTGDSRGPSWWMVSSPSTLHIPISTSGCSMVARGSHVSAIGSGHTWQPQYPFTTRINSTSATESSRRGAINCSMSKWTSCAG